MLSYLPPWATAEQKKRRDYISTKRPSSIQVPKDKIKQRQLEGLPYLINLQQGLDRSQVRKNRFPGSAAPVRRLPPG